MKKLLIALGAALVASALVMTNVAAQGAHYETSEEGSVVIGSAMEIGGSLYGAGDVINVAGSVDGDVYCAGRDILITGTVEGDVICAGQTVRIQGTVNGDVRAAAQSVIIDGTINGSVSAFAETVQVGPEAVIGRDFNGAGQTLSVHGEITRDLFFAGAAVVIDGTVGRDVAGEYESLTVNEGATVGGNARFSGNDVEIAPGSVAGTTDYAPLTKTTVDGSDFENTMRAFSAVTLIVGALVLVLLFPGMVRRATNVTMSRFWLSALLGMGLLFGTPILALLIALTVVGIPIAFLLMLFWLIALMLALPVVSYYVGRLILSHFKVGNSVAIMAIGVLAIVIATNLPWIGGIISFIGTVAGIGLLAFAIARRWSKPDYRTESTVKARR